jgi:serine/threonine-protein kinase
MSHPPRSGSASARGSAVQGAWRLPPRLLESAAKRISLLSVFVAVLVVVVQLFQQVAQPELAPVMADPVNRLVTLSAVLMAAGLFALAHFQLVTSSTLIALGMCFEIAVAMTISMIETTLPMTPGEPVLGMSSLGPWIFAMGVLIPNRPMWTLVTALVAASTWPAAYAINAARFDFAPVPTGQLIAWPVINYLLAGLAYMIGRWTYGTAIAAQTAQDLGSYRLVSPIGEGGMGEVWRAEHQMLARAAAIKLVKPDVMAQSSARLAEVSVKRFKREANIIASLQSPHTIYLYDFGVTPEGYFYYIMELLDGISLQTLVTTFGPQPAGRVSAFLRQIGESLEEAHQQGLIHRDLKPSNIMACKLALSYDFIKVLDFGLAKTVQSSEVTQLTMEGATTGTPGYMAPEIAIGEGGVDARADIYALGCVAYFMLTGSLVFTDSNPMKMAIKHVQAVPEPPSQRTELPIPASLERVIMQCLAKKPEDRPGSARELGRLVSACDVPAWTEEDAAEWWETHLPPTSSLRSFAREDGPSPRVVRKA